MKIDERLAVASIIIEPEECLNIGEVDDESLLNQLNLNGTESSVDIHKSSDLETEKQL